MAAAYILCQSIVIVTAAAALLRHPNAPGPPALAAVAIDVGILANADLIFWMCSSLLPPPAPTTLNPAEPVLVAASATANDACVLVAFLGDATSEPQ